MKNTTLFLVALLSLFISCKEKSKEVKNNDSQGTSLSIDYANGFSIKQYSNHTIITVTEAFPGAQNEFKYALIPRDSSGNNTDIEQSNKLEEKLKSQGVDAILKTPLNTVVVTSTTHIPSLEMLEVAETLKGFPNLNYISSPLSRKRIANKEIIDLGQNESLNTELTIELRPEAIISFGVEGENKSLNSVERAGIPVLYNGDWVEKDPLGKAEWIKFFGALYGKEREADSIFNHIKTNYNLLKEQIATIENKPTVLSGGMFKDIWYLPKGDSWQAKVLEDAGGNYLWSETEGAGSIALSIESVLEKGQQADFWIAPGQYTSYTKLASDNPAYAQFDAFKNKKVYTFAKYKGETGGLLYYELAPNRPDLVLRDLAKILHPEMITEAFTFFDTLDE
ncbi:ABC transporter substrate-binding protein [Dokdonia sp. Asnod3-C12]|uniref:ABC transporter substrate-binding protein n=1 Tax=Dokdonia sp. Asnod3-C12 TaxID=3160575 RepID=UPI00386CB733